MRIRISRSVVPNLFTVLNIFFGFLSIISAVNNQFSIAIWYIGFSAICDALDGVMARLTKSASEFGVELDSLADVVAFGVAPSFLVYKLALSQFGSLGTLIAAMPLIFGALRLARFNVQLTGFDKDHFSGLPIPLAALTIISFIHFFTPEEIQSTALLQNVLLGLVIAVSLLMVSVIRYPVLPKFSKRTFREHPIQMSLVIAGGILIAASGLKALFPILLSVVLSGIGFASFRKMKIFFRQRGEDEVDEDELEPQPSPVKHHRFIK